MSPWCHYAKMSGVVQALGKKLLLGYPEVSNYTVPGPEKELCSIKPREMYVL